MQRVAKWQCGSKQVKDFQDAMNAPQDDTLLVHYNSSEKAAMYSLVIHHHIVLEHIIEERRKYSCTCLLKTSSGREKLQPTTVCGERNFSC